MTSRTVEEEIQEEKSKQPDSDDEYALATENTASELAEERVEEETVSESPGDEVVDETAVAEEIEAIPYGDVDDDSVDADGNLIDESEEVNEKILEDIEEEIEGEPGKEMPALGCYVFCSALFHLQTNVPTHRNRGERWRRRSIVNRGRGEDRGPPGVAGGR